MTAVLSEKGLTCILSKQPRLSLLVLGGRHLLCMGQMSGLRHAVLETQPLLTCLQPA